MALFQHGVDASPSVTFSNAIDVLGRGGIPSALGSVNNPVDGRGNMPTTVSRGNGHTSLGMGNKPFTVLGPYTTHGSSDTVKRSLLWVVTAVSTCSRRCLNWQDKQNKKKKRRKQ